MAKNFKPTDKITVKNLYPWDTGFQVFNDKTDRDSDCTIKGGELYKRLTYEQVENEIFKGNKAFVGIDGHGNHAPLMIVDDDACLALLAVTERPKQLSEDVLKQLFSIGDRKEFNKMLADYVVDKQEKKYTGYYFMNNVNQDDISSFLVGDLERHLGIKFNEPDTRQYTYGVDKNTY